MAVHPSPPPLPFTDATSEWSEAAVDASNSLAATLAKEMAERWRRGERPGAEEFLSRHPSLWEQPQAAARLIYEEICLRQETGQEHASVEVVQRFPQWQDQLRALLWGRLSRTVPTGTQFPDVGEEIAGFQLVSKLGEGARGRVYLAEQPDLANRPVVLKITSCDGREHLS